MNPIGYWIDVDTLLDQLSDHAEDASHRYFQGNVNDRVGMDRAAGEVKAFRLAISLIRIQRDANL